MGREKRSEMKKRRLEKPTSCAGVFEILVWDEINQKWSAPLGNNRFRAFGYEPGLTGQLERKAPYFRSFAEAKAYALNHRREKQKVIHPKLEKPNPAAGMLFGELVKKWEESYLSNKDVSTQIRYRSYLKYFHLFWNTPVEQIDTNAIDSWITHIKSPAILNAAHPTRCSYDHEFSVLRTILKFYATRMNRNYRLPFLPDQMAALVVRPKKKQKKDLRIEEVLMFFNALKQVCAEFDCEVIYYVAKMQYGIYGRVQEAAALHYEDFDFNRKRVNVNKKVQWLRAKGHEDQLVQGSKANDGKEITLSVLAATVFREWTMKSGIRSGPLFTLNGELLTYRQIEYRYTQALKRAGLPFSGTHILRHAALTEAYDTSKDLKLTARLAGHSDLKSTEKYVKIRDEQMDQVQKQMDEKLSVLL
jgi:integrase